MKSHGIAPLVWTFLAVTISFTLLTYLVQTNQTIALDKAVLSSVNAHSSTFWDVLFVMITQLGSFAAIVVITAGLSVMLLLRREYKKTAFLLTSVAGAAAVNALLKLLFERTRPEIWEQLVLEMSFSFPSGHSVAICALVLAVVAVLWRTRFRGLAIGVGVALVIAVGLSRLYLGVHFPTDVLGGWLMSCSWVAAMGIVFSLVGKRKTL